MTRTFMRGLGLGLSLTALAGGAVAQTAALPQAADAYFTDSKATLAQLLAQQPIEGRAKNVILIVGDGMSIPTLTAARILGGQLQGKDGESNRLTMDSLPYTALSKTYTNDSQVADSAPTATAMVSGIKGNNGTIGVTGAVKEGDCAASLQAGSNVTTIFEQAEAAGKATGVVSTTRITHATPAAAYAKTSMRDWENDSQLPPEAAAAGCKDIASQLVEWPAGNGFEVILGGGRSNFLPATMADPEAADKTGARADGRDLTAEWLARSNDAAYVWNQEQFDAVDPAKTGRLMGLFQPSHMNYEADRATDKAGEPSLAQMTGKAIDMLARNEDGYALMVEAGRIDHGHHDGNGYRALTDTLALDEAVKTVLSKVDLNETLVVVTADHGHVFSIAGYPQRNNPILGIAGTADDGKPYTTLGYQNGPGAMPDGARADLTGVDTSAPDFLQPALVPLADGETHSGEDVAIMAAGPWAQLFRGVVEQNTIYQIMAYATGLDQGPNR